MRPRLALAPATLIEARFAPVATRSGRVTPDSSLPISLFVEPELLGALQALAAELREAWRRMVSASLGRGQPPAPGPLAAVLAALARELWAASPTLMARTEIAEPFRLVPTSPVQAATVQFPLDAMTFFSDRVRTHWRQAPVRIDVRETLPAMLALLPLLVEGVEDEQLGRLATTLPRQLRDGLHQLRFASFVTTALPRARRELPRDSVAHLGHATLLANLDGAYVLVDPWFPPPSLADSSRPWAVSELPPLSAVLFTHHHWDHLHLDTLLQFARTTPLYVPRQASSQLLGPRSSALLTYLGFHEVHELAAGVRICLGPRAEILALPFYGEDPTRLGFRGLTYVLRTGSAGALVHVDSGPDADGRALADDPALATIVDSLRIAPVLATRRQERGFMIEHTWEFLFRDVSEWVSPAENCCNDAAALAHLAAMTRTERLVLYAEGGADWYPPGTDFLRGAGPSARTLPFEFLADPLDVITERVRSVGAAVVLSRPLDVHAIG